MSLSVENKSLPPIVNTLSIKTQALDDFSFREPVVRIKLICSRHLSQLSSALLAYVVCQCFAFILHTA
jgi:hypothetical protein